jgi:hypothetical protein
MADKSEALRLADALQQQAVWEGHYGPSYLRDLLPEAAAELRRLHALNGELLEALKNLEKEFRKVYPIYYYAEPWGHETNVPLQAARAAIAKAEGEKT